MARRLFRGCGDGAAASSCSGGGAASSSSLSSSHPTSFLGPGMLWCAGASGRALACGGGVTRRVDPAPAAGSASSVVAVAPRLLVRERRRHRRRLGVTSRCFGRGCRRRGVVRRCRRRRRRAQAPQARPEGAPVLVVASARGLRSSLRRARCSGSFARARYIRLVPVRAACCVLLCCGAASGGAASRGAQRSKSGEDR